MIEMAVRMGVGFNCFNRFNLTELSAENAMGNWDWWTLKRVSTLKLKRFLADSMACHLFTRQLFVLRLFVYASGVLIFGNGKRWGGGTTQPKATRSHPFWGSGAGRRGRWEGGKEARRQFTGSRGGCWDRRVVNSFVNEGVKFPSK